MKKIAIFQSDLKVGGIQKSLINFLNNLDLSECYVDLYLFDTSTFFDFKPSDRINIIYLKKYNYLNRFIFFGLLRLLKKNNRIKGDYDISIDFNSYWNECAINALSVNSKKKVMWIHNDVKIKRKEELKYRILWFFFKGKFKYFDEFVAVSSGVVEPFREESKIYNKRITVIPNFVDSTEIINKSKETIDFKVNNQKYNLVSMGRLCHQKGFDILIDYFYQITKKRNDIHLYIIGDGPDKKKLKTQIDSYNLNSFITLLGNKANPYPFLRLMDGFILTSRYEGQGIVIWEAKALGLDIFIPKDLEKYNDGIAGCKDIINRVANSIKKDKKNDTLTSYNENVITKLHNLILN